MIGSNPGRYAVNTDRPVCDGGVTPQQRSGARLNRGRSKQAVGTPPAFPDDFQLRLAIADFALDAAASPENAISAQYYTEAHDALSQQWTRDGALGLAEFRVPSIAPSLHHASSSFVLPTTRSARSRYSLLSG
jgi:hypothetical protein